ncbi:MAG: hypothetical protein ACRCX2_23145 [Paraclostridium sp.]
MADMNKIKNHPGFMPFGHANVKGGDTTDTQSAKDKEKSVKEESSDSSK